jgi:hypothetical protein
MVSDHRSVKRLLSEENGVGSGINTAILNRKNDARLFLACAVVIGGWSVVRVGPVDRSIGEPPYAASVSSDRSAQRGSRFVGQGEGPNAEGILLASSAVRLLPRKAHPAVGPSSPTSHTPWS